jgi:hypothetical protein
MDVETLMKKGNINRATASTNLNEHSSRSHMVLSLDIKSGIVGEDPTTGTFFLVDLAGSERVRKSAVDGDELKEATHINKSLSALGNVMEALDKKSKHVPFRDSKLTYLLQDSLGGNSRTMMIVAVCPTNISSAETLTALQFATRVRRVKIGPAKRNVKSKNLEETVKEMSQQLKMVEKSKEKSEEQLKSLKKDYDRVQEQLSCLSTPPASETSSENASNRSDRSRRVTRVRVRVNNPNNNTETDSRLKKEIELRKSATNELKITKTESKRLQHQLREARKEIDRLKGKSIVVGRALRPSKMKDREETNRKNRTYVKEIKSQKESKIKNERRRKNERKDNKENMKEAKVDSWEAGSHSDEEDEAHSSSKDKSDTEKLLNDSESGTSSDSSSVIETRAKVLEILKKHDPTRVEKIDELMNAHKGREQLLLKRLTSRYDDIYKRWHVAQKKDVSDAEELLNNSESGTSSDSSSVIETRAKILEILKKHDPRRVDKIDELMNAHEGREQWLLKSLTSRYDDFYKRWHAAQKQKVVVPGTPSDSLSVNEIREQVLKLLEKNDPKSVDRIDIIMEGFRGRESVLLQKMKERFSNTRKPNKNKSLHTKKEQGRTRTRTNAYKKSKERYSKKAPMKVTSDYY